MNHEQENKEIFEWMHPEKCWHERGFLDSKSGVYSCKKCGVTIVTDKLISHRNPDYFTDLNTIHEVEVKIVDEFGEKRYFQAVQSVQQTIGVLSCITASAAERATACLRIIREVGKDE